MKRIAVLLLAAASISACATVTKGTDDTVRMQSVPTGANVTISETRGKLTDVQCTTPCELELNRKWSYNVEFVKTGYKTLTTLLEPKLSGDGTAGMAGNILLGGVIGAGVDAATGAMNDLKPNPMVANLVAEEAEAVSEVLGEDAAEAVVDGDAEDAGA